MESYKRAIHTGWDYRVMWMLMGHTVLDTDGISFTLQGFCHGSGKPRTGRSVMRLSSRDGSAGYVRELVARAAWQGKVTS
jgi:hypothetical protein